MDTRFFGPSAWQLFHLITFKSKDPEEFLQIIKDILPCRFCRESTAQFMKELPLKGDPSRWLYHLHNKVNHKLRSQCKDDPNVIDPGPDPSFEEVKNRYENLKLTEVPGRDFLFSVTINYPDEPDVSQIETQKIFIKLLSEVYPFELLRKVFQKYYEKNPLNLDSRRSYSKWMYGLISALSKKVGSKIPSYRGYVQHTMYYKSGCSKKSYKGKTCRKLATGDRTKDRDHLKTRRVAHLHTL